MATIPANITLLWNGTNGSIPDGWARDTAIDGYFLRGINTTTTEPGGTGGNATHNHTVLAHTHTMGSHTHSVGTSVNSAPTKVYKGSIGMDSHSHGSLPSNSSTPTIQNETVTIESQPNLPAYYSLIPIYSNGTRGAPLGSIALFPSLTLPVGWSRCDGYDGTPNLTGKNIKMAESGEDAGANGDGFHVHNGTHTHISDGHSHTGSVDYKSTANQGGPDTLSSTFASTNHRHSYNTSSDAIVNYNSSSNVNASKVSDPPNIAMPIMQNKLADDLLPDGLIGIWRGFLTAIPVGWSLCDGNDGRPNMIAKFVVGCSPTNALESGGTLSAHTHTASPHTHLQDNHTHSGDTGSSSGSSSRIDTSATPKDEQPSRTSHSHPLVVYSNSTTMNSSTVTFITTSSDVPVYYEVAFIQYGATVDPGVDIPEDKCGYALL